MVVTTVGWVSCTGDDNDVTNEAPYFEVSPVTINARGVVPFTETFKVCTNQAWIITEKPLWISLDATEGIGDKEIGITITSSEKNYRAVFYQKIKNLKRVLRFSRMGIPYQLVQVIIKVLK